MSVLSGSVMAESYKRTLETTFMDYYLLFPFWMGSLTRIYMWINCMKKFKSEPSGGFKDGIELPEDSWKCNYTLWPFFSSVIIKKVWRWRSCEQYNTCSIWWFPWWHRVARGLLKLPLDVVTFFRPGIIFNSGKKKLCKIVMSPFWISTMMAQTYERTLESVVMGCGMFFF